VPNYLPVQTEYTIDINLRSVYQGYKPSLPDAEKDCEAFIHSLWSVGIRPLWISVLNLQTVRLCFATWSQAYSCELAVRKVLDLLWLVEDTLPDDDPWKEIHHGGADEPTDQSDLPTWWRG